MPKHQYMPVHTISHIHVTVSIPSVLKTQQNHTKTLDLDGENGNSKRVDCKNLAIEVYTTFPTHLADTVKHNNRYKCRAVAG